MALIWIGDKNRSFNERLKFVVNYRCKQQSLKTGEKVTQRTIAEKVGINIDTFKSYLKSPGFDYATGKRKNPTQPNFETYKKICDVLDIPYGFLLGEDIPFDIYQSGLYGYLKRIKDLDIAYDFENEDKLRLKIADYEADFSESELSKELENYIKMMIIRESIKSK